MAQSRVIGDLNVSRSVETLRANESLVEVASTGTLAINVAKTIRFTGSTAITGTFPAANVAPLKNGSQIYLLNDSSANVTINLDGGSNLGTIAAGGVVLATLRDNSTAAGLWDFSLINAVAGAAQKFNSTFNATTDWGSPSGGEYTRTITAATHGRGTTPLYEVFVDDGSNFDKIDGIETTVNASGDVSIVINETPDERFAGKIEFI